MTQDVRIGNINNRLAVAADNVRFARTLAAHARMLKPTEKADVRKAALQVIAELGALLDMLEIEMTD